MNDMMRQLHLPQSLILVLAVLASSLAPLSAQQSPQSAAAPVVAPPSVSLPAAGTSITQRTAPAGATKQQVPERTAPREETMRLPLRKLIALDSAMLLRNAFSVYTIFVPTSARLKFKSCTLNLDFTNSIALLSDRSVLRVVMNDIIVAQYRLDRNKPFNSTEVSIPTELLKTGFNRLQFIVAQHYANQCEDPGAPELFTEINPDTSYLSAVAEWRDVPQRLSYLRWWVDEKLWSPYQFNVCFPGSGQMTDLQLAWGGHHHTGRRSGAELPALPRHLGQRPPRRDG